MSKDLIYIEAALHLGGKHALQQATEIVVNICQVLVRPLYKGLVLLVQRAVGLEDRGEAVPSA